MLKKSLVLFVSIFLLLGLSLVGTAQDYFLSTGDCLDISVYGYQELQVKELVIRPDGKIGFPLVGEVQAAGLTPGTLSANLTKSLAEYVINPRVTVNVVKFHTIRVYVLGEVSRPGMYEIEKQHNLLDALSMAGGYTRFTSKKSVYIVEKATGKHIRVNLKKLLTKGDLTQNRQLNDGDVVYLGRNGLSFVTDILPLITGAHQLNEIFK